MDDARLDEYLSQGYLVFRQIVPPALLRDLRRQADIARELAHTLNSPQTQRLQPLDKYADRLDLRPFRDYIELPEIGAAVTRLLGPGYTHGQLETMGLLVEPLTHPWHLGWHRDGVVEVPPEERDEAIREMLEAIWHDLRYFNQVNCALYPDSCTWFVPGSHLRQHDLPGEHQTTGDPTLRRPPKRRSNQEAEQHYLAHCLQMPGAVQIHLEPGDLMLYRNLGWHTGNYRTQQPRATIHDFVNHADWLTWQAVWTQTKQMSITRLTARQDAGRSRLFKLTRFPIAWVNAARNRVKRSLTQCSMRDEGT